MILTREQAQGIIKKVLSFAAADEINVDLDGGRSGNTRFALNSVTTCADHDTLFVSVTACYGKRHGSASCTEIDDISLKRLVQRAEELARFSPEDPEYMPLLGPQDYADLEPYAEAATKATPELRVKAVLSTIEHAESKGLTAAGFYGHNYGFSAAGNSAGLFSYYRSSGAGFSATVRTLDGAGSGWATSNSHNIDDVDYETVGGVAAQKAVASQNPIELEPGVYPVILEPQAIPEFLGTAFHSMNTRGADEGRTFYAKPGGGNKIGEKIMGDNITVTSDPANALLPCPPVGSDGFPVQPGTWVANGVLKQLSCSRYWAQKQGVEHVGGPCNLIFKGGEGTLEDLIKDTKRAVLVTRFWYIRDLDPQTILLTGLTRDGTFLIEDGKIKHAVKNFRFNESPIAVLNKITGMSQPERVGGSLVPAMRASEFTFSSTSDSV